MTLVLDTNVIVSALLSPAGHPAEIINLWEAEKIEVVSSPPLLIELERVLQYPRVQKYLKRTQSDVDAFLRQFKKIAITVEPQMTLDIIKEDPADNRVLECAVAGEASYIISGNDHLLKIKEYKGIVILKPAEFLTLVDLR
jgi:hypothetical protein